MTVYAVGGEADTFSLVSGHTYVQETGVGRFDSNLSRGAMLISNGASELYLPFGTTLSSAWIHMRLYQETLAAGTSYISLRNAAGDETEYRISIDSSGYWTVERFKSASYDSLGTSSSPVCTADTLQDVDIFYTRSLTVGVFQIYRNGVQLLNFSGDSDTESAIGMIRFEGLVGGSNEMNVSQVVVADESTIGWKLATLAPDGNGAQTAWTNDYTAIDEFTYNASDFIETNATSQTETFTLANINAAYSTYNVKAVAVGARASNDSGSAVADIQAVVRVSGTDYTSSNLSLTKDGSEYTKQNVWNTNPATASAWNQTAVNALEAGVKSV